MIVSNCFRSIKTKASRPTARSIHGWSPSPDIGFWNFYQRLLRQDPVGKLGLSESKYWQLKLWQHCMSSIWCQLWNWSSHHSLMLSAPWLKQQRAEGDKNSTHLQVLLSSCDAHTAHWVSTVCRVDIWWRGFGGGRIGFIQEQLLHSVCGLHDTCYTGVWGVSRIIKSANMRAIASRFMLAPLVIPIQSGDRNCRGVRDHIWSATVSL